MFGKCCLPLFIFLLTAQACLPKPVCPSLSAQAYLPKPVCPSLSAQACLAKPVCPSLSTQAFKNFQSMFAISCQPIPACPSPSVQVFLPKPARPYLPSQAHLSKTFYLNLPAHSSLPKSATTILRACRGCISRRVKPSS